MPAPAKVLDLIERFDRNLAAYKSGQYNEAQARKEFIDPLFEALGWDMDNKKGYAEAYKDVVHEDSLRVEGAAKAPDYSFRIGGQRKFFVEAKKPSVDVKSDIHPAYQLRRYAWSAKLPLSILTDFEEFAVYDCRVKPDKGDQAATARVMYFGFRDYATRWDEIAALFSPDAILRGSFDAYAESKTAKRGTAEVDAAFLAEIQRWRELLAKNIALRNPSLSQRDLNYAVQLIIDRIIFLRICEARGIEPEGGLRDLGKGRDVYANLVYSFRQADARYNSGLFHFEAEKGRATSPDSLTPGLVIDDKVLKDILANLYYPDSPYEFSVIPADILGHVYEQFLGQVIRLTPGRRVSIEDKPEVRKAGGVYYTPTYIVDYIVRETVGRLVEGRSEVTSPLRVLDPACGSGSFLLGAYQFLLDWHLQWYATHQPEKLARGRKAPIAPDPSGGWRLTIDERKRILLDHIFGVDIDPQAVEVTKLSLLLKVLEGESSQTLNPQLSLLHERALPDLSANIKCGNSLIGPDFYEGGQLSLFDDETLRRINAFDWEAEFPQVFRPDRSAETCQVCGFDVVIGNPPYGADLTTPEKSYLSLHYPLQSYQFDSYLLFLEKATQILKHHGFVGYIIPNTWLLNLTSSKLRIFFLQNTEIQIIVHYGRSVFPRVTVDTEIVILRNMVPAENHKIRIEVISKDSRSESYEIAQLSWSTPDGSPVNILRRQEYDLLVAKLRSHPVFDTVMKITQGAKPFQVGKGKPPQTRHIVETKPFVSETWVDATYRPLLRGSLIQKYAILWNDNYYISFGDWLAEPRHSADHDAPGKLVVRQTGDSLIGAFDDKQFIVRDNLYTIVPRDSRVNLKYVLGLLNSKLLNWFYQNVINPEAGEALAQVKRGHLALLPLKLPDQALTADVARHDQMVELVQRMLDLHQRLAAALTPHDKTLLQRQIEATDKQIDRLVYELYELTEGEIGVVEGR